MAPHEQARIADQLHITDPNSTRRDSGLAIDVAVGLGASIKRLPSRYFYDDKGSVLFQRIMALPEYYLTRVEREILVERGDAIVAYLADGGAALDLIELGSGDGDKTIELCRAAMRAPITAVYYPIDVSGHALGELQARFDAGLPGMPVVPIHGDYFEHWPRTRDGGRQIVMFFGSNLGNLCFKESVALLCSIRARLSPGDVLLLGVDMQKDPKTILAAYNDRQGVTAEFNMNLLTRLNRELDMDFDLLSFSHYATYDPLSGTARSFLVSGRRQSVHSRCLGRTFEFEEGETIYVEQSQKYTREMIKDLAKASGFQVDRHFSDASNWYEIAALRFAPEQ